MIRMSNEYRMKLLDSKSNANWRGCRKNVVGRIGGRGRKFARRGVVDT
jgi:hypothetical protein